jgi:hypothetical protein
MKVEENTGMIGRRPSTTYFQPRVEIHVNNGKAGMTGQRPSTTRCHHSHSTPSEFLQEGKCERNKSSRAGSERK